MEVFLYNSTVCRLCGEENDKGCLIYSGEENKQRLCDIINTYLPIKVLDDGVLPRTICPGCTIQLEATTEFINLIINGQKVLRDLHQREKHYKKTLDDTNDTTEIITENIVFDISTEDGVYETEHPTVLQVAGLNKPKRKRGRPPKKSKSPEELALEAASKEREREQRVKNESKNEDPSGKRRRKTPTRFKEAVQGKELERIFIEEGVIDGDESEHEAIIEPELKSKESSKEPEVIGHKASSGELVVVTKGKGRGRPKGRMRVTREECAICGMTFSCVGRYMSHVASHGPVLYQCTACSHTFSTRLQFNTHQRDTGHTGQNVMSHTAEQPHKDTKTVLMDKELAEDQNQEIQEQVLSTSDAVQDTQMTSQELPDLSETVVKELKVESVPELNTEEVELSNDNESTSPIENSEVANDDSSPRASNAVRAVALVRVTHNGDTLQPPPVPAVNEDPLLLDKKDDKGKHKCNHCEKIFSSRQSKSLHTKAAHYGERPYVCRECGATFAYPRSLKLHAVVHRRTNASKGFACDLCGKVLNHPSSVVYHKEAAHANQRYVCSKCGKTFKHKQLLQRHQLVHSQLRPYTCKTCNAGFKTKANLINHQLLHTGIKKFTCEICKHKFAHKTSLTLHLRWHSGLKPFSCSKCGKSFSQKGNLSEHERIHTGEKPFECAVCLRRFTTSSQHALHARRHAADKPYACTQPHCGKRFASRSAWQAHARRESGVTNARAHRCTVCTRAFPERWALRKHMRRHTGERPFRCPHCPRAFADCSNLNKHKKQIHKQVNQQVSLLVNDKNQTQPLKQELDKMQQTQPQQSNESQHIVEQSPASTKSDHEDELEESVIYVTYDVENSNAFHILDPEQAASVECVSNASTTCSLYADSPLPELAEQLHVAPYELNAAAAHVPVTDEQGNPLHFTMQDGTRLAITSVDGKSLQVITQDGQTIPVEINGYADEEVTEGGDMVVHQLSLQKSVEGSAAPHCFTIV